MLICNSEHSQNERVYYTITWQIYYFGIPCKLPSCSIYCTYCVLQKQCDQCVSMVFIVCQYGIINMAVMNTANFDNCNRLFWYSMHTSILHAHVYIPHTVKTVQPQRSLLYSIAQRSLHKYLANVVGHAGFPCIQTPFMHNIQYTGASQ